ncbi:MAG: hypothetical protein ACOYMW_02925 [Candidatus Competibacteraceae bacterium]
MRHSLDMRAIEDKLVDFFSKLVDIAKARGWTSDSKWTDGIFQELTDIGHAHGCMVFAPMNRCSSDNGGWLYDFHWRISDEKKPFIRMPLAMEIEWGFGRNQDKLLVEITSDFLKLVQARCDIRIMVFQCRDVESVIDNLITMAETFEGSQQGDRYLFAAYSFDDHQMHCRLWSA